MTRRRVLVLGGSGMLGHKVWQACNERHEAWATVRESEPVATSALDHDRAPATAGALDHDRVLPGVDASELGSVVAALDECAPDVVVNCIGIIKQAAAAEDPIASTAINSLFPHQLASICAGRGARLVHISTDCVYSGRRGNYSEDDLPDPPDLYGRSKLLGEVTGDGTLTIRTSIIGRELRGHLGLLDWFLLGGHAAVHGYRRALFSGLTTNALADLISRVIIAGDRALQGLWHVSGDPISKYDLLVLAARAFELATEIVPDDSVVIDRSLDSARFRAATGWTPQPWPEMVEAIAVERANYARIEP